MRSTSSLADQRAAIEVEQVERNLRAVGMHDFAARTCRARGVRLEDALSKHKGARGRDAHAARAKAMRVRTEIIAVTVATLACSLPEAGRIFRLDHTTVLEHVRRHEDRLREQLGMEARR